MRIQHLGWRSSCRRQMTEKYAFIDVDSRCNTINSGSQDTVVQWTKTKLRSFVTHYTPNIVCH
jgi:hypothetical protein